MFHPMSLSDLSPCPTSLSGGWQHIKPPYVSEPSFSSTPHSYFFPFFFCYIFSKSVLFNFIFVPCLPASSVFYPSPTITSLHPSPHFVFSLFYSIVFPFTESSHVQGPTAAGCHHGVEVSIQFTSNACGCKHPSPSDHTCCSHCHLQPSICCQPMAQHRW